MALMVEKAAYEDFVKREKENFQRFKGDNAPFDDTEFLQYQNTVMKAKHGQVEVLMKKMSLSHSLANSDMSDVARQKAEAANVRNELEFKAVLEETKLRTKLLLSFLPSEKALENPTGGGESSRDAERKKKGGGS